MPEISKRQFSRSEILNALQALGDELAARGVRGQIFIVGGAAMALEDDEDIELLIRECDLHTADEALELLERMYPTLEPQPKTRLFLEELFGPADSPGYRSLT